MEVSRGEIIEALQNIFAELTNINDVAKTISRLSMAHAKMLRVEALEVELNKTKSFVYKFNASCKAETEKIDLHKFAFSDLIDNVKAIFFELESKEKKKLESSREGNQSNSAVGINDNNSRVRLPKINLPEFSGNIGQWPQFHDLFVTLVHNNRSLSDIEKFQYLKCALQGNALKLIDSLHVTSENYVVAFNLLLQTYQNKRLLANYYTKQLFEFRPIETDSPNNLQKFLLTFRTNVHALQALNLEDLPDFLLLYKALHSLDFNTVQLFEAKYAGEEIPSFSQLIAFVEDRFKVNSLCSDSKVRAPRLGKAPQILLNRTDKKKNLCVACKEPSHNLYRCPKFVNLTPLERFKLVKKNNYCYNCLNNKHLSQDCKSSFVCSTCSQKHHSLIHLGNLDEARKDKTESERVETVPTATVLHSRKNSPLNAKNEVLLSTVQVAVPINSNNFQRIRLLVDSGSQANLITFDCCKQLGISIRTAKSSIRGLSSAQHPIRGLCTFFISPHFDISVKLKVDALVVDYITDKLPAVAFDASRLSFLMGLTLADDNFNCPGRIDGLLGASTFAKIVKTEVLKDREGDLCALQTSLGYIVMGSLPEHKNETNPMSLCLFKEPSLENLVSKFWEMEDLESTPSNLVEEEICENLFKSTLVRNNDGRYSVDLPFREDPSELGNSYNFAKFRFLSLERKLDKSVIMRENYNKVIENHLKAGYISEVVNPNLLEGYFLPHHGVLRPSSKSTPLRVVFDASAKTSNSKSLNDILYAGPKLQSDLRKILLTFRLFPVALTADVKQMYLQIGVNSHHRKYQRFLWRFRPQDPLKIFELNTVTFGIKSSPFLALRVVKQLAEDEKNNFPNACRIVPSEMYVDDLTTSCNDLEEAQNLFKELVSLFRAGKFDLVKWTSNCSDFLNSILPQLRLQEEIKFDHDDYFKVLGLRWQPGPDIFTFAVDNLEIKGACTKRAVLSTMARIYDPLGFLACVTVFIKILLKELWTLKLDWDEAPPIGIIKDWQIFTSELSCLPSFKLPRHLEVKRNSIVQLVGFCDASSKAYGAVVYLRTSCGSSYKSLLVSAKSKVSPLKNALTIPRLELCSAVLLSKLFKLVIDAFQSKIVVEKIFAFSDSQIVLYWIKSPPTKWKTFVANRVSQIHEGLPQIEWLRVSGTDNPADCISRSIKPSALLDHPLWLHGPTWLGRNVECWPVLPQTEELIDEKILEVKPPLVLVSLEPPNIILELSLHCSSWTKFRNIVVYVRRFARLVKNFSTRISLFELEQAENCVFRALQATYFKEDLNLLKQNKLSSPKLRHLAPFLQENLIRVGGRLAHAKLPFKTIHPILLPKRDHIVNLIIDHYHQVNLHTGPSLLLSLIRQKYWILDARVVIKARIRACNFCFRFKPLSVSPVMAPLPAARVGTSKAFEYTGVDYMGPFAITLRRGRGFRSQKAWICIFICLATKAIHLEVASDLSTACFMDALKRFLARRGACRKLFSDQGKNFIGAKSKLDELYTFLESKEFCETFSLNLNKMAIAWSFNPPSAPHFGGLWEANVRSVKSHLLKIVGKQILTYEELLTVASQIESLLNSRPLSLLSDDPSELEPLTPAHFLNAAPLKFIPSENLDHVDPSKLSRPKLVDGIVQHFWRRWRREYLHTLQRRQKWVAPSTPIQIGTIVLIDVENAPPLHWPLGCVEKVFPGEDGVVRVAQVKTSKGSYRRPVVKLCPLPTQ